MFSTGSRQLLIAVVIGAAGGCTTMKNQVKSLMGKDSTGTTTSAGNVGSVQSEGYIKGPPPVLDQTFRVHHHPSALDQAPVLHVPRFDWRPHVDRSGGSFGDAGSQSGGALGGGSGTRHRRGT